MSYIDSIVPVLTYCTIRIVDDKDSYVEVSIVSLNEFQPINLWSDIVRFVSLYLQVLDNLPHDLIYSENQVSPWMEVWVEKQQDR